MLLKIVSQVGADLTVQISDQYVAWLLIMGYVMYKILMSLYYMRRRWIRSHRVPVEYLPTPPAEEVSRELSTEEEVEEEEDPAEEESPGAPDVLQPAVQREAVSPVLGPLEVQQQEVVQQEEVSPVPVCQEVLQRAVTQAVIPAVLVRPEVRPQEATQIAVPTEAVPRPAIAHPRTQQPAEPDVNMLWPMLMFAPATGDSYHRVGCGNLLCARS